MRKAILDFLPVLALITFGFGAVKISGVLAFIVFMGAIYALYVAVHEDIKEE